MFIIISDSCPTTMAYNKMRKVCFSKQSENVWANWTEALAYCRITYPGGHLLYIETAQEMKDLERRHGMTYNVISLHLRGLRGIALTLSVWLCVCVSVRPAKENFNV